MMTMMTLGHRINRSTYLTLTFNYKVKITVTSFLYVALPSCHICIQNMMVMDLLNELHRASKRNYVGWNKNDSGPREQAETSLKIEDLRSNITTGKLS